MKLKYIIPSLMSVIAMLVGCTEKFEPSYLDGLRVSTSYVAISPEGSATDVFVTSAANWEIQNVPEWLTVTPKSGNAGSSTVTISAPAAAGIKNVNLKLVSGNLVQEIFVSQGKKASVEIATCKQVIEGSDGKTYQVKGTVTNIANTTYGNWYLDDGTGQVYIYGTLDANGATKNFTSLGMEVGDVVTVEGPKTTYNGTVELVDVTVLKIEKSIVKVDGPSSCEIGKEGGDFIVKLAFKGNVSTTIPDDCNWLRYKTTTVTKGTVTAVTPNPADTAFVKFAVDANDGGGRSAVITFNCIDASNSSKITYTVKQAANVLPHGENPDDPFSVAETIAKCIAIGNTTDGVIYYAKGIISSISSIDTGSYGNATFNISDDGNDENAIVCYRSFFLDNAKFTSEDQIKVGDEVVITGKLVNYKDKAGKETPEFSGNVYVYSYKKASNDPGTKNNPFTIAQAIAYIDGGGKDNVYVKGVVSELVSGGFGAQYGNGSFYISDDGKKYGDATKDFEAYQVNWLGNQKWTEGTPQIAVGDVVILYGPLTKYKTTYETQGKSAAYIYTLNGKTK